MNAPRTRSIGFLGFGAISTRIVQLAAQIGHRVVARDFAALDDVLPPRTILLTNTSYISITDLASATGKPSRSAGRTSTPPPSGRRSRFYIASSQATRFEKVKALLTTFGKLPIVLKKDVPGFVRNRFLMPLLIEVAAVGGRSREEGGDRPAVQKGDWVPDRAVQTRLL